MLEIWYGIQVDLAKLKEILHKFDLDKEAKILQRIHNGDKEFDNCTDLKEICDSLNLQECKVIPCGVCCKREDTDDFIIGKKNYDFGMCERTEFTEEIQLVDENEKTIVDDFFVEYEYEFSLERPKHYLNSDACYICGY